MCPYFSLWHVSCVLESCVYRYALECVFVFSSWFILSCKILIMWYMQPPPPRFLMRCATLHLKCCTSEVFHLTWCLPLSTCRWPWPFLHQWLSLAPSSSQDSWPTRPHLRVSEKKWQKNRKQLIPLLTIILKGGWMNTNLYQSYLSWTFFGRKLLIIKDINTCISLKQNPNN